MKICSQLYNLARSPLSFSSKLEVIKTLGYDGVELAGFNGKDYEGVDPETFRGLLDKLGLEVNGAHVQFGRLEDSMAEVIAYHKALGVHWIGISRPMPYFPEGTEFSVIRERMSHYPETKEELDVIVEKLNAYAAALREAGLDLYYHTHDFEHREIDGVMLRERLLQETDVPLEIDIGWATKKGALTPEGLTEFLRKHASRIKWLHLKGNDHDQSCPLDQGQLDCGFYYRYAKEAGHDFAIVEDDAQLPDAITSICRSRMAIAEFEKG